jgi:hypothetical protein
MAVGIRHAHHATHSIRKSWHKLRRQARGLIPRSLVFSLVLNAVAYWSRNYATSRKVADAKPDVMNDFLPIYLILPAALGPRVYSASNRNEYQKQKNNISVE